LSTNPWVQIPETVDDVVDELATATTAGSPALAVLPVLKPHARFVVSPRVGLPQRSVNVPRGTVARWWVGTHGGAGETTLEQLLEGTRATGHAWPQTDEPGSEPPQVLLVARTSARGLRSAQLAAIEWASGKVAVRLHGLVLIADAPGRLPKPLKDLAHVVGGGVPRVWRLPWVEAWRLGEPVSAETAPRAVTAVLDELRSSNLIMSIT
jgi:hypothetical protein